MAHETQKACSAPSAQYLDPAYGDAALQNFLHHYRTAYRKLRGLHCNAATSSHRAFRYAAFGSTGRFVNGYTQMRIHLSR